MLREQLQLKVNFISKPSAFESEIHPSHKTSFCTLCTVSYTHLDVYKRQTLYSIAMRSFTNYTRMGIRTMSVLSCVGAGICLIIAIVYFILKLCNWNAYQTGTIPILLIILTLGFFQLFFIGLLGEYMYCLLYTSRCV